MCGEPGSNLAGTLLIIGAGLWMLQGLKSASREPPISRARTTEPLRAPHPGWPFPERPGPRWLGSLIATISVLVNFTFIPFEPWWALTIIFIDLWVIPLVVGIDAYATHRKESQQWPMTSMCSTSEPRRQALHQHALHHMVGYRSHRMTPPKGSRMTDRIIGVRSKRILIMPRKPVHPLKPGWVTLTICQCSIVRASTPAMQLTRWCMSTDLESRTPSPRQPHSPRATVRSYPIYPGWVAVSGPNEDSTYPGLRRR